MYYCICTYIINLKLPRSRPVNPVMLHTPWALWIPFVPRCGLGGPSSEHMHPCNVPAICSIVLRKCVYGAGGCNTSACVYICSIIVFAYVMIV